MAAKTTAGVDAARRLRDLRERLGIPKERVALAFGMSAENWRHYESGRNQLAVAMLPTLADLYGMPVAELAAELLDGEPGHTLSSNGNGSPTKGTANYSETESLNRDLGHRVVRADHFRELAVAGR